MFLLRFRFKPEYLKFPGFFSAYLFHKVLIALLVVDLVDA
jgi:hypothetical protein